MPRPFLFVLFPIFSILLYGQEILNNDSILKLTAAHVSDVVILDLIGSRSGQYDLSADAIVRLKVAGASDAVISALISNTRTQSPVSSTAPRPLTKEPSPQDFIKQKGESRMSTALQGAALVRLSFVQSVSYSEAPKSVELRVMDDVSLDGSVLKRGTRVGAIVYPVSSRLLGRGNLAVTLRDVDLAGHAQVSFSDLQGAGFKGLKKEQATVTTLKSPWRLVVLPVLRGKEAEILADTIIKAYARTVMTSHAAAPDDERTSQSSIYLLGKRLAEGESSLHREVQ